MRSTVWRCAVCRALDPARAGGVDPHLGGGSERRREARPESIKLPLPSAERSRRLIGVAWPAGASSRAKLAKTFRAIQWGLGRDPGLGGWGSRSRFIDFARNLLELLVDGFRAPPGGAHGHNLAVAPSPSGGTWGVRTRRRLVGWSAERLAFCCSAVCAGAMLRGC